MTRAPRRVCGGPSAGHLIAGPTLLRCALGSAGLVHAKREGDGGTPAGRFRLLSGFFRPDRTRRPHAPFPVAALRRDQGWCDDPSSASYNRLVRLPCRASHEKMWRHDRLYDLVVVLDHNIKPRRKGRGSAIFLHIAAKDYPATAGCVAISPGDMRRLLPRLGRGCTVVLR